MSRNATVTVKHIPLQTVIVTAVLAIFAAGLLFQPLRWTATPAYGTLINILPVWAWGVIHLVAAVAMALSLFVRTRFISITAHTMAIVLLMSWWIAFIIRTITDPATTIVNPTNWLVLLALAGWSALRIDEPRL